MIMMGQRTTVVAGLALALLFVPAAASARAPELRFSVTEGQIRNEFYRDGLVAAHLVLRSGNAARLLVAFPAGNSGVGLWFENAPPTLAWGQGTSIAPVTRRLADGAVRYGITTEISANVASLTVRRALLSNVRVLRDFGYGNPVPASVEAMPSITRRSVSWERRRIDGAAGYALSIRMLDGEVAGGNGTPVRLVARPGRPLRFRLTALTGDTPLTPIPASDIFAGDAGADQQLRNALTFMSYDEKLLAGSWRFNTYFGRDTLMSVRLLMPALRPRVIEAGLGSVFARLNAAGEVAHEEDLDEYALLHRARAGEPLSAAAILDYKMVDDDFMLAPVVAHYLLDTADGRARATDFLARRTPSGDAYGTLLMRNLAYVLDQARPFADAPRFDRLISLRAGQMTGEWRDSLNGLGGDGRYPYNINAALVPAALDAAARLSASGLLDRYQGGIDLSGAQRMATIWEREASPLFAVELSADEARRRANAYAAAIGVAAVETSNAPMRFNAIALDAIGRPVDVMHSDEGFMLLFTSPDPGVLGNALSALVRPFPAGLMTDAGLLVANPAFASPVRHSIFDRTRYHGTVVWSWQQGLLAAGIARQLARTDLPPTSRALLAQGQAALTRATAGARALRGSELWSWTYADGRYSPALFGQNEGDETESNAAQLWSTIDLVQLR